MPSWGARRAGAFTLVETVISILINGVVMVAVMNTVGASRMAQYTHTHRSRGLMLAQDLMTEILQHPYWDPVAESGMGPAPSETVTGDRTLFNDIDDYDGWTASPPELRDGTPIAWAGGYTRQVDVSWLNTGNLNGLSNAPLRLLVRMSTLTAFSNWRVWRSCRWSCTMRKLHV